MCDLYKWLCLDIDNKKEGRFKVSTSPTFNINFFKHNKIHDNEMTREREYMLYLTPDEVSIIFKL
jgi:hypothetical protein